MLTNQEKCYQRDNDIIKALNEQGVLDADQLQFMFFPSQRMAQKRLFRLWKLKKIKRQRFDSIQPFHYYIDKILKFPEHRLGVNWARIWVDKKLPAWEYIYSAEYELDYGVIRPDLFLIIKNNITGKLRGVFIEHERSFDKFDKVQKYNDWYESGAYMVENWQFEKFPTVLIVSNRKITIKNNTHDINFQVVELSNIIREVLEWKQ